MGIVRIIIEQKVNTKAEGQAFAKQFLQQNNLIEKIRNFYVSDGSNVLVAYDESQEFQKQDFEI